MVLRTRFLRWKESLFEACDPASLGIFRICFGLLMIGHCVLLLVQDDFYTLWVAPRVHFPFEIGQLLPSLSPFIWFPIMLIASLGLTLGYAYRFWAILLFLSKTYETFTEKAYYQNHFYLLYLLSFLMIFIEGDAWAALGGKVRSVPFWNIWILRFQLFCLYFFAGITKLTPYWLSGVAMHHTLAKLSEQTGFIPLILCTPFAENFLIYGGLVFDLSIGFLLWLPQTRILAFLGLVMFHYVNGYILFSPLTDASIGIFPLLGISSALIFFNPNWPRKILKKIGTLDSISKYPSLLSKKVSFILLTIVAIYAAFQVIFPMVCFFIWNPHSGIKQRFSWTEDSHILMPRVHMVVTAPSQPSFELSPIEGLASLQFQGLYSDPKAVLSYKLFLMDKLSKETAIDRPHIWVYSRVYVDTPPMMKKHL